MTIESGMLEQGYVKAEAGYNQIATVLATNAFRHRSISLTGKNNREASEEKRGTPGQAQSLPRRSSAGFDVSSIWEPSGTPGTAGYLAPFFKAGMGAETDVTLNTTVSANPLATGCTLTSAGTLAVGDCVVVTLAAAARREITRLKSVAGAVVTWDTLSAAPDNPGKILGGTTYKLATNLPNSISIFKYLTAGGYKEAVSGGLVNSINLTFDGTKECEVQFQGPGAYKVPTGSVAAKPAAYTTSGNPVGGTVGNFYLAGTAFLITKAQIKIENGIDLRNAEIGTALATGFFRVNWRRVTVSVSFYLESTDLIAAAESHTAQTLRLLTGATDGSMIGAVLPKVEFEIPDIPSDNGPKIVTCEGVAYETDGNDQVFLAEF